MTEERRLLTIPEAAREIGMSRAVLWRHVKKGHLEKVKAGPHILIDAEELARFKARERKAGRPRKPTP